MTPRRLAPALAALAAGAVVVALIPDGVTVDPLELTATLALGWSFVIAGVIVSAQRPGNRLGPVMVLTGFAWFASRLAWSDASALYTLGILFEVTYMLGIGYLLVDVPRRPPAWPPRARDLRDRDPHHRPAAARLDAARGGRRALVRAPGEPPGRRRRARRVALAIVRVQQILGAVAVLLTIAVLVRRWRGASPRLRFAIAPVLWTGAVAFARGAGLAPQRRARRAARRSAGRADPVRRSRPCRSPSWPACCA